MNWRSHDRMLKYREPLFVDADLSLALVVLAKLDIRLPALQSVDPGSVQLGRATACGVGKLLNEAVGK